MKFKLVILTTAAAVFAACGGTANNTANNTRTNVSNMAANNANMNHAVNSNTNTNRWNANVSREEYERNRSEYERNKGNEETIGQSLEDSWLWFKTKSALMTTSDLRDSTINVDVENGVITLKGTVASAAEKAKAKQVADGIEGRKKVVDQLKVAPNDSMMNTNSSSNKNSNHR